MMDLTAAVKVLKHFTSCFSYDDIYFVFTKDSSEAKEAIKVIEEHLFNDIWHKVEGVEDELRDEKFGKIVMCKWEDGCIEPFSSKLINIYNLNPAEFGKIIEWKVYYEDDPENI